MKKIITTILCIMILLVSTFFTIIYLDNEDCLSIHVNINRTESRKNDIRETALNRENGFCILVSVTNDSTNNIVCNEDRTVNYDKSYMLRKVKIEKIYRKGSEVSFMEGDYIDFELRHFMYYTKKDSDKHEIPVLDTHKVKNTNDLLRVTYNISCGSLKPYNYYLICGINVNNRYTLVNRYDGSFEINYENIDEVKKMNLQQIQANFIEKSAD